MRAKTAKGFPWCACFLLAVAFTTGILLRQYAPLWFCGLVSVFAAVSCLCLSEMRSRSTLLLLVAVLFLGSWRYDAASKVPVNDISRLLGVVSGVEGIVTSDPETRGARTHFVLRVERVKTSVGWCAAGGRVMVSLDGGHALKWRARNSNSGVVVRPEYGDRIRITSRLYSPSEQRNPINFSWKGYLARKGIYTCASISNPDQLRLVDRRLGCSLVHGALGIRRAVIRSIYRIYPSPENSVIAGMVLGTYAYLPPQVLCDFTRTGTLHLLAASGYNCWVLALFLSGLLQWMRVTRNHRSLIIIGALIAYLLVVGCKPSLVRATIMLSLALIARPLNRVPDTRNLFFVAGLIILAFDPASLFDIGFQLSFLAVWGIIYVSPMLGVNAVLGAFQNAAPPAGRTGKGFIFWLVRKIAAGLGATAIATTSAVLVTAPVIAYYFNYISLVAIPANVAVELGVPIVFGAGLFAPVAATVPVFGSAVAYSGTLVTRGMLDGIGFLGSGLHSAVSAPSIPPVAIAGYYLVLHALLSFMNVRSSGKLK